LNNTTNIEEFEQSSFLCMNSEGEKGNAFVSIPQNVHTYICRNSCLDNTNVEIKQASLLTKSLLDIFQ